MTVVAMLAIGWLFAVIVFAPEPWQTRPWTLWEECARVLITILGWPLWAGMVLLFRLGMRIPEWVAVPLFITLYILSGVFWATTIQAVISRLKTKNDWVWRPWKRHP